MLYEFDWTDFPEDNILQAGKSKKSVTICGNVGLTCGKSRYNIVVSHRHWTKKSRCFLLDVFKQEKDGSYDWLGNKTIKTANDIRHFARWAEDLVIDLLKYPE